MKKIKDCIAKNWKDYMTIILMSFSVVCILLDIKKSVIFQIFIHHIF